jgi:hypothetical protein
MCFSSHVCRNASQHMTCYWSRDREMIRTAPRGPAKATGEAGGTAWNTPPTRRIFRACQWPWIHPKSSANTFLESELPKRMDAIFFRPVLALGLGWRAIQKKLAHVCTYSIPRIRYACLSWSDGWFIVPLPASGHNQIWHERRLD